LTQKSIQCHKQPCERSPTALGGPLNGPSIAKDSAMWNEHIETLSVPGLSARATHLLCRFIALSDRSLAHPLAWRRFYGFVRYAHAHRARLTPDDLQATLVSCGFQTSDAQCLSLVYSHGRAIIKAGTPVFHSGRFWGDK
jgi:hypothetical protein